jgi:hypothetical protein
MGYIKIQPNDHDDLLMEAIKTFDEYQYAIQRHERTTTHVEGV